MGFYEATPKNLEIRKSPIHGNGLFAKEDIPKNTKLGLGWVTLFDPGFGYIDKIRTPIGGHCNHSDDPNIFKKYNEDKSYDHIEYLDIITLRDIKKDEELTIKYEIPPE